MGIKPARAKGCVRFSLGIYNTAEEVDYVLKHLPEVIAKLRAAGPHHGHKTRETKHTAEPARHAV
jgi:cysteine sulfinate desulfinase/cysteine desulfurase-like protein